MADSGLPIGVNQGTTCCCVGIFHDGTVEVEVIANEQDSRITVSHLQAKLCPYQSCFSGTTMFSLFSTPGWQQMEPGWAG